jgi:plastocyanin
MRALLGVAVLGLLLPILAPGASADPATVDVSMNGDLCFFVLSILCTFSPAAATAHVGDTVRWTNHALLTPHTATSQDAGFDSGLVQPGLSFDWTAAQAGTFHYVCLLHPGMEADLTVLP